MSERFDVVIGNPPYQNESVGQGTQTPPIYHEFMDAAYEIGDKAVLITPARFLFNAGATPKAWNRAMLDDEHLKVAKYVQRSGDVFPGTDIKGGVAVTYRDANRKLGPIGTFVPIPELADILNKVRVQPRESLSSIISGRGVYQLSHDALLEHPAISDLQSVGHKADVGTGAFSILRDVVFFEDKPTDDDEYVQFIGLADGKRGWRWIKRRYIAEPADFDAYKVIFPKSNGSGALGEVLSTPLIGTPLIGYTETFIAAGSFATRDEAAACLKYIKTKFARVMLGVLKISQDNTAAKWRNVPLQDFTSESDIDWSKPVAAIDQQLYDKYNLDKDEIAFIETHVKSME